MLVFRYFKLFCNGRIASQIVTRPSEYSSQLFPAMQTMWETFVTFG